MQNLAEIKETLKSLRCCIIIPTYNNSSTLKKVVEEVQQYADDVIVVNDGSTDTTSGILLSFNNIDVVSYLPNKGKGIALRKGFKHASDKGFRYAITIDSDGQHFADDIPVFINKIKEKEDSVIIGARNMAQAGIPGKSSFGHKFSNFWFRFETGINLPDTQSGFRLYPLEALKGMRFFTSKYEFEIEVIVRAAWRGIAIDSVPVKVYYAPKDERVSHFRPFKDFSRVSVLNTVLVTLAIVYYIPIRLIKGLQKKSIRQHLIHAINNKEESNLKKSYAIALGVFVGILPIWGYQLIAALTLAHFLKLNKILTAVASNISIPPAIPFIIYLSFLMGSWLPGSDASSTKELSFNWEFISSNFLQYLAGSICLSFIASIVIGTIAYGALRIFRREG